MTQDEQDAYHYQQMVAYLSERAEDYARSGDEWHRSADKIAKFSPGLAAAVRDMALAYEQLAIRAREHAR